MLRSSKEVSGPERGGRGGCDRLKFRESRWVGPTAGHRSCEPAEYGKEPALAAGAGEPLGACRTVET